jgi:hypothetical protein
MFFKLIVLSGVFLLISCGKKIDCAEFQKRIEICHESFAQRLTPGKKTDKAKFKLLLKNKVRKSCDSRGGKVGDASKIKRCLSKSGCDNFVNCILGKKDNLNQD